MSKSLEMHVWIEYFLMNVGPIAKTLIFHNFFEVIYCHLGSVWTPDSSSPASFIH